MRTLFSRTTAKLAVGAALAALAGATPAAHAQGTAIPFGPPVSSYPGDPWAVVGPSEVDLVGLKVVPLGAIPPLGAPYVDEATAAELAAEARAAKANVVWNEAVDAFRHGAYLDATRLSETLQTDFPEWRRAKLLRTQSLFASGKYRAAAFALRDAIETLPEGEWGVIVAGYRQYYGHSAALVDQINALRKYIDRHPDEAEGHLLLSYLIGYLGHPRDAIDLLATHHKLAPDDEAGPLLCTAFAKLSGIPVPEPALVNDAETGRAAPAERKSDAPATLVAPPTDAPREPRPPAKALPSGVPEPPANPGATRENSTVPAAPAKRSSGPREL